MWFVIAAMLKAREMREKEMKHCICAKFNADSHLCSCITQLFSLAPTYQKSMFREYILQDLQSYQSTPFPLESLTASCSSRDLSITSSRTQKTLWSWVFFVRTPPKKQKNKTYNLSTCSATAAVFLSPSAASGVCSGSPTVVRLRTAWCEMPHAQSHRGRQERCDITDFLSCSLLWLLTKECKHVKISQRSSSLPSSLVTYCFVLFFIMLLCSSYAVEMHERMPFSFFWSL